VNARLPADPVAFELFYMRYKPLVISVSMKLLLDTTDAEDIAQTVFLKIWQRPELFRGGNLEGWLACVTRNATIDMIRRRQATDTSEFEPNTRFEQMQSVEDEVLRKMDAYNVRYAVEQLPERLRLLVFESFWRGTPHERIAAETRLPLGTVKTRIRSGITRLRKRVQKAGG
jgi:RNA polymerase sigma-70 factor (ECF subfamily)